MANSITLAPAETTTSVQAEVEFIAAQDIPLEQRTDVTVDELEKLSLPAPAELYGGKVVFKMASFAHGVIEHNIGAEIRNYLKTNPIGLLSGDANFRLWPKRARESRAPDLSFILKERLPENLFRYLPMAPDLAIEILSPDDKFMQVMDKVDEYLSQGVKIVWVVIASTREVLFCTSQSKYIVRDKLAAPGLLPGFELEVKDIFLGL